MLLSVIIVSFNTAELTLQTIKSVISEVSDSSLLKNQTEILLVDNHSEDNSLTEITKLKLQTTFPIHLIANKENLGFAQANNLGIEKSSGDYILLLNSDTVVKNQALTHMVQVFLDQAADPTTDVLHSHEDELDHLGILAAQLRNPDGSYQPQGGSFPGLMSLTCHMMMWDDLPVIGRWLPSTQDTGKHAHHDEKQKNLELKDWVGGTAMMLKKEMLNEIGLLDGHIFMYGEDIELCLRAHHHHWDVALDHGAQITHYGSASSSSKNAILGELKGYLYIWSKHKPLWQVPLVRGIIRTGCVLRHLLFGTILNNPQKADIYQTALDIL